MRPIKERANIYNVLFLMAILFHDLWISLWKTRGVRCGRNEADSVAGQELARPGDGKIG